jgi:putative transposase
LKSMLSQQSARPVWLNDGSCIRLRPEHKDHVWAYDFVSARTHDGLPLRLLVIVDELTRECLSIDVERRLSSDDVLERLAWLMATRGVPKNFAATTGPGLPRASCVTGWARWACGRCTSTRQPVGERLRGELQRQAARRVAQR